MDIENGFDCFQWRCPNMNGTNQKFIFRVQQCMCWAWGVFDDVYKTRFYVRPSEIVDNENALQQPPTNQPTIISSNIFYKIFCISPGFTCLMAIGDVPPNFTTLQSPYSQFGIFLVTRTYNSIREYFEETFPIVPVFVCKFFGQIPKRSNNIYFSIAFMQHQRHWRLTQFLWQVFFTARQPFFGCCFVCTLRTMNDLTTWTKWTTPNIAEQQHNILRWRTNCLGDWWKLADTKVIQMAVFDGYKIMLT